jgi:hypothetical protein
MPSIYTGNFSMVVMPGSNAIITKNAEVQNIALQQGAQFQVNPAIQFKVNQ